MQPPKLDRTRIHVWSASLAVERNCVESCYAILTSDERLRADRFRVAHARRRFIVARAFLRRTLSVYLQTDPASLDVVYRPLGKPYLANESEIRFNLSHADDKATMAVASQREVGVDIEAVARDVDIDAVAREAFSPPELRALNSLAPAARRDAFYRIWTRKEAYVKARGEGLSYSTQCFTVSHLPMDYDALRTDDQDGGALSDWRVAEIPAPAGFHAALAAKGCDWSVLQLDAPAFAPR